MGDTEGRDELAQVCVKNLYEVYQYVDGVMARDLKPLIGAADLKQAGKEQDVGKLLLSSVQTFLHEIQGMKAKLNQSQKQYCTMRDQMNFFKARTADLQAESARKDKIISSLGEELPLVP